MRKIGSSMMLLVFIMTAIFMTACTQLASLETQESAAIDTPAENNITEEDLVIDKLNYTEDGRVNLEIYRHSSSKEPLPAIISLPGGAFGFLADTDKDPTAMTFYERGFQAFVLNYSVGEYSGFPAPLDEVSWAIWQIRSHADAWNVDPDKIVVMGFSAGVSVAGMSATQWNTPGLYERVGAPDGESIRPNAAVMGYGACDTSGTIVDNPDVVNPGIWGKIVTDRTPELDYL